VKLCFVGSTDGLSERVLKSFREAVELTSHNSVVLLNVCFNYGARWDVCNAAQLLAAKGLPITEEALSLNLSTSHCGDPDLIIRTGGEHRLSNFLLWQAAYAELYFSDALWPDFDEVAFDNALSDYASRERRFGRTSSQVATLGNEQQ
jgi:undecaprenyl diphosphate synthase